MTTNDVVKLLALKLNVSQAQARVLLRRKLAQLRQTLLAAEQVSLPGLGKLSLRTTSARRNYIPGKDAYCYIPARKRIAFKFDNALKKTLQQRPQD